MQNEIKKADRRKTTNLLKKFLLDKYGIKASVKSEVYSMGSSLRIEWAGGPCADVVEMDVKKLQYGYFDGMNDIYEYTEIEAFIIDGYQLETFKHVFAEQTGVEEIRKRAMFLLDSKYSSYCGAHKLNTDEDYKRSFPETIGGAWTWEQMGYQLLNHISFCTQDLANIELVDIVENTGKPWEMALVYKYDGKEYRTDVFEKHVPENKAAASPQTEAAPAVNGLQMVDYSEKAVAVIGETYQYKDFLKQLGGSFNRALTINGQKVAGWIFSKRKEAELRMALQG